MLTSRTLFALPGALPGILLGALLAIAWPALLRAQGVCDSPPYAALDYLVGEWRLARDQGEELGRSTWRRAAGGCLLVEDFRDTRGQEVHGMLYRDPESGEWHGSWVDSSGNVVRVRGEDGADRIALEGEASSLQGGAIARVTFERGESPADGVRQLLEMSSDDGATWATVSDARYLPLGASSAPAPAPTVEPTPTRRRERARASEPEAPAPPAAEPAAPRPVIERSAREEDQPAPAPAPSIAVLSEKSRSPSRDPVRMASPMQLQIPIGPVEDLPEGYGWSSTETAPYTAGEVSIRKVEVTQRRRGGRSTLQVILYVHGATFIERADLLVELLDPEGGVTASQEAAGVSVGRGIPSQSDRGAVAQPFKFELEREALAALFAGDRRPQLRLTVTVRD
ncbi:MAG TPA: hypothetical protein VMV46_17315 [Thermoanaerobaculia bacterium]|nr:hypothetical protein [Thermoanaerobaculia bacterium]